MSAAQNRFKQARAPSGGSAVAAGASVGASTRAAQNRFKQVNARSEGSATAAGVSVGAYA